MICINTVVEAMLQSGDSHMIVTQHTTIVYQCSVV